MLPMVPISRLPWQEFDLWVQCLSTILGPIVRHMLDLLVECVIDLEADFRFLIQLLKVHNGLTEYVCLKLATTTVII